jgi:hypothetical protein
VTLVFYLPAHHQALLLLLLSSFTSHVILANSLDLRLELAHICSSPSFRGLNG